ncbi:MAG: hypothetical protein IKE59_02465 [Erysipelotrichaceae bacterium]|nr:hypothetical protein [Erysipelotrichaceae bacterium]
MKYLREIFAAFIVMIAGSILVVVDTLVRHHAHAHSHAFTHTHDGSTHTHTITHTHGHDHFITEETYGHHHTMAEPDHLSAPQHTQEGHA